ncbi:MAG: hypothetical protein FWG36_10975, partial [Oscillospiraceae bacterium]|nr:hypothetical protein [Oscillospiraceae bacterium]
MKSTKREYFVLFVFSIVISGLGYILEMTASTTDGGFLATRVIYSSAWFTVPLFLMFLQKYCEISLPKIVNGFIFVSAVFFILLVWTSDKHTLYYTSYWYDDVSEIHHLAITRGKLYILGMMHPVACIVISVVIIIKRM